MYVTLSRVIFYARHARSIIDNYARLGCYVRAYAYAHVSNITSRKIIFHMKTDRGRLKLQFRSFRRLAPFNLFLFQGYALHNPFHEWLFSETDPFFFLKFCKRFFNFFLIPVISIRAYQIRIDRMKIISGRNYYSIFELFRRRCEQSVSLVYFFFFFKDYKWHV